MLKLGRKVEYALISLLHMADLNEDELVSKRELSESYSIPSELLGKVLQQLKKAGIVESIQGIHGGYKLAKAFNSIALGNVIEAVEGPMHTLECNCISHACNREEVCNIKFMMNRFYNDLQQFVFNTSLSTFQTGFNPQTTTLTVNIEV